MPDRDIEEAARDEREVRHRARGPRRTYLLVLVGVAILTIGMVIGTFVLGRYVFGDEAALSDTKALLAEIQKALTQSEDRNWAYSRENQNLKDELENLRARAGSTSTTPSLMPGSRPLPATYSDGIYLVGQGIEAGTYDGIVSGEVGYWARLSDTDGSVHAIITNGLPRGPFVLTVLPSDKAVELRGVEITLR